MGVPKVGDKYLDLRSTIYTVSAVNDDGLIILVYTNDNKHNVMVYSNIDILRSKIKREYLIDLNTKAGKLLYVDSNN